MAVHKKRTRLVKGEEPRFEVVTPVVYFALHAKVGTLRLMPSAEMASIYMRCGWKLLYKVNCYPKR